LAIIRNIIVVARCYQIVDDSTNLWVSPRRVLSQQSRLSFKRRPLQRI